MALLLINAIGRKDLPIHESEIIRAMNYMPLGPVLLSD